MQQKAARNPIEDTAGPFRPRVWRLYYLDILIQNNLLERDNQMTQGVCARYKIYGAEKDRIERFQGLTA